VRLNDEHEIFGSPFDVEILPSRTLARYCTAEGEALSGIMANQTQTFTVIAMDGFGNRKINGGDPFEVGVMGPAQLRALTDNADGSYTCTIAAFSPSSAAYVTSSSLMIQVTLHGKPIAGSPFKPIITEDLRSLYATSTQGRNSGAASMVSAVSSPAGSTLQSPHPGKHAMAQQQSAQQQGSVFSGRSVNGNSNSSTLDNLLNELDLEADASARSVSAAPEPPAARSSNSSVAGSRTPPPPPQSSRAAPPAPYTPPPAGSSASVASASRSVPPAANKANATPTTGVPVRQSTNTPSAAANTPAAAAPAPAPAAATPGGGGLSRLERSRQRALLAKALAESSPAPAPVSAGAAAAPMAPGGAADLSGEYAGGRKPSKLEELQRTMAGNNAASPQQQQQQQKAAGSVQSQVKKMVSDLQFLLFQAHKCPKLH
jgi:hypothetical protein